MKNQLPALSSNLYRRPKPPCRQPDGTDCAKRHVGCQGKCEKYLAFRSELDAINEKARMDSICDEIKSRQIYRNRASLKKTEAGRRALAQR